MSVHPNGTGTGWTEDVDIDQPHGLDYRYVNHLAIAVRKRIEKEHVAFGDTTAGGEHIPGKCGVMLVCDDTADFTAYVDATTAPLGAMMYCISHASLYCMTGTASAGSPDITVVRIGPLSICKGADFTWDGAHLFDFSVDFSDVAITGDLTIAGKIETDGTVNFNGDVAFLADASFDGTVDFGDGVAFGAEVSIDGVVKIDNTAPQFGGTAGIGLFYDPTVQAAEESITFPNGLIFKHGKTSSIAAYATLDVTYGTAFPNAIISMSATPVLDAGHMNEAWMVGQKTGALLSIGQIKNKCSAPHAYYWQAWGY